MTFAALRTDVFRRLNESSTTPVFWTEDDVENALNEGYAELSDQTEWYERWLSIDLLNNRPYYDLRTVVPRTVLSIRAAFNEQTNRWLTPSRVADVETYDRRWEKKIGSDAGTVKQYYTALPDPMVLDDDEPGFPDAFHPGLVEYAVADLWAQDAETDLALQAWRAYLSYETALQAWVDGRVSVPMVHGHGDQPGNPAR
jgi:hypothetical protein